MPRVMLRAALPAVALLAGCFMSLDENRWKHADQGPARDLRRDGAQGDARPDAPLDLAVDAKPDAPATDVPRSDGPGVDAKKPDGPKPDGPKPDQKKTDAPKPDQLKLDTKKIDAPKPDLLKPDTKKIDAPKPDLPKPDLPRVDLPGTCATMSLSLQAAVDDGEIWPPDFFPDGEPGSEIFIGFDSDPMWGYFRFTLSQAIPAGATIASATLTLFGAGTWQWGGNKGLNVRAELASDAPVVSSAAEVPGNPGGRTITTAVVRWPASGGLAWASGADNVSPSLAPILQEVVTAKGGLAQGSHLQLWLRNAQSSDGAVITPDFKAASYASHPARLAITFCK
jgi:hypothetical protein